MVIASFLMNIAAAADFSIEDILIKTRRRKDREISVIATFGETWNDFRDGLTRLRGRAGEQGFLDILEDFRDNMRDEEGHEGATEDLVKIRNAIAHHDFFILGGNVYIGGIRYRDVEGEQHFDLVASNILEINTSMLRGLVSTFIAWENMMVLLFDPPHPKDDVRDEERYETAWQMLRRITY